MARTDEVVDAIKQMIVTGDLGPGDRLPTEKDLAAQLGLSRGSLREGVRALIVMGVLDTRQGDGTYVTSLDPGRLFAHLSFVADLDEEGALHFLAVRRVLEAEAAGDAAIRISSQQLAFAEELLREDESALAGEAPMDHERLLENDRSFHRIIAEAAGNPVLTALLESLAGRTWRARLWRSKVDTGVVARTLAEHRAVLTALAERDSERARLRMSVHILGVEDFVREANAEPAG